jgi:hypothetical protein
MAATYTFFLMTLVVLRSIYPALLDRRSDHDDEQQRRPPPSLLRPLARAPCQPGQRAQANR